MAINTGNTTTPPRTVLLNFKWTTSRGATTDGWNICSCYADGVKVNSNCGGNYDMKGTALADYINDNYQDRLLKISHRAHSRYTINVNAQHQYRRLQALSNKPIKRGKLWLVGKKTFYGMTSYKYMGEKKAFKVLLDGACGFGTIQDICNYIGLSLKYCGDTNNSTKYIITDKRSN